MPVGYGDRAHELERCVCLEWVNVGGLEIQVDTENAISKAYC